MMRKGLKQTLAERKQLQHILPLMLERVQRLPARKDGLKKTHQNAHVTSYSEMRLGMGKLPSPYLAVCATLKKEGYTVITMITLSRWMLFGAAQPVTENYTWS
jgi:hypothetical protein